MNTRRLVGVLQQQGQTVMVYSDHPDLTVIQQSAAFVPFRAPTGDEIIHCLHCGYTYLYRRGQVNACPNCNMTIGDT